MGLYAVYFRIFALRLNVGCDVSGKGGSKQSYLNCK